MSDVYALNPGSPLVTPALDSPTDNPTDAGDLDLPDHMHGTKEDDLIITTGSSHVRDGGEGNDTIYGSDEGDTLIGGAGSDELNGGWGRDSLSGGDGADTLDGGPGGDTLDGGLGPDRYIIDESEDRVVNEAAASPNDKSSNIDTVIAYSSIESLWANVENIELHRRYAVTATGNDLNNYISGNELYNWLEGLGGNDTLYGGMGGDVLVGGLGDDTYIIDDSDTIKEKPGEGVDTVHSPDEYTLGATLENLVLEGYEAIRGTGNELPNSIKGNEAANILYGMLGADTLEGGEGNDTLDGGAGADVMRGGLDDDIYHRDDMADQVIEEENEGTDVIITSISVDLLPNNIENLVLTGTAGISGVGNALGNVLMGNAGHNSLSGAGGNDALDGGRGADTLIGGTGNDRLTGGFGNDIFIIRANDGKDTISDFSFHLGNDDLIKLQLGVDYDSFGEVHDAAVDDDGDVVFTFGALGVLTLKGVSKVMLTDGDFLFV